MQCFPDTSALVKRYVREFDSRRMRALWSDPANVIYISQLTSTELASALGRLLREGSVDVDFVRRATHAFRLDIGRRVRVLALTPALQDVAERLVFAHPLRAADALQLATALAAARVVALAGEGLSFITADRRQAAAALAEGLDVELLEG